MYNAKIQKWGNSQAIRIPRYILEQAKLKEGDTVQILLEDDKIVIFQPKRHLKEITIEELFEGYTDDYKPKELNWGEPVGKEKW